MKDAFQLLIKRVLTKKPKLGQDSDNIAGVFGGGKAES